MSKNSMDLRTFCYNFRVGTLSIVYSTVSGTCLKWTYSSIDYRVASLYTRYQTAKGIIPESLKSLGQF